MELNLLRILCFLTLTVAITHAALSPELYWKSQLPNTQMPQSIRDIIHSEFLDNKGTDVVVGGGGVGVDSGRGTQVGVGTGGVGVSTGKPGRRTNVGVGKGGVSVSTGHKGKPVFVGGQPRPDSFVYFYEASDTQTNADPNVALFFLEKDLQKGKTMTLRFTKTTNLATFLARNTANSIPFSSKKFPEILDRFSVKPGSGEAGVMKNTIKECEEVGIKGEEKYCATSLESMVDYAMSKLGKKVNVISTEVNKESQLQKYTIRGVKRVSGEESKYEICHKLNYPYAVFYCHKTESTKASVVPLKGEDGAEVKAVAICHTDTSKWNPKHLAFKMLGVVPGSVPICHFLPQDHIVWYGN